MSILAASGQVCMASSRVYVQEGVRDKFIEKYKQILQSVKIGDPTDLETMYGPQADKIQFDNVNRYIESGKQSGANLVLGGSVSDGEGGYFVEPSQYHGLYRLSVISTDLFRSHLHQYARRC